MFASFTFWLIVLAALVLYLCASVGLRWRAEAILQRRREQASRGNAFDASSIAPQIRRVHADPLAVIRARPHYTSHRGGLIAVARKMVRSLPFFHEQEHESQVLPGSRL